MWVKEASKCKGWALGQMTFSELAANWAFLELKEINSPTFYYSKVGWIWQVLVS